MQLKITAEITAVEFKFINSFEWAVLEILLSFSDQPPSTLESTERLCLHESGFLHAAIESLAQIGAVQSRSGVSCGLDLENFMLTEGGKTVHRDGGYEIGVPGVETGDFVLEWPSAKIASAKAHASGKPKSIKAIPPNEEIQRRLALQELEGWLNSQGSAHQKIKSYYITNVEPS